MTAGNGDDGGKPSSTAPGQARAPVDTPGRMVVRSGKHDAAADSTTMAAADTAMALAVSASGTMPEAHEEDVGATEPEARGQGDDEDMLVGTTLQGRYSITRKIGQGGMGAVYEATHELIGKRVAVKVLLDKYAKKDQVVARLEQEARLASAIGHEHIIDITDFGTTSDGRTFVVMEFLEGESLAECLSREGTLPEQRILSVAHQIASALGAAHAKGIIHRDVKPENVFLLRRKDRDFVKVVDFGISKNLRSSGENPDSPRLTQTGMVLGTPLYMSPEQARGDEQLDHRIDIYALGVIMYELATGKVPFGGNNYLSVISQVLNDEPTRPRALRPELTEEFEAVVLRALEKDREKRYQSTEEFLNDLSALLDDPMRSTARPRIMAPLRWRKRGGATKVLVWVVGVSLVIAAVAVTVSMMMKDDKPRVAAAFDAAPASAPPVDGPPAISQVPPDGSPAARQIEIWIDTVPSKADVIDADGNVKRTPFKYTIAEDSAPVKFTAELDGYDSRNFTVDPAKDAGHADRKSALKVKLTKQRGGGGSGKRPPGDGVKKPPPDDNGGGGKVSCPDGLKPNPATGKCGPG
jgi:serine/threonine protein kinase